MERNVQELVKYWEDVPGKMSIASEKDQYIKENLAILLNNQKQKDIKAETIFESTITNTAAQTNTGGDGAFSPISLALVRRTFPELFANKVVGVQAMAGPVGLAYALRFFHQTGLAPEVEAAFNAVEDYSGYTGDDLSLSGAKDTGRGAVGATAEGFKIGGSGSAKMPELSLKIDQTAVTAATRKLAASFSLEAAQDIKAMHGVDVEREMVNVLQYEIQAEMDREIVGRLQALAEDTAKGGKTADILDLSATAASGAISTDGRWSQEKFSGVVTQIIKQANDIAISTRRGAGNFAIVSTRLATALQAAGPVFSRNQANVNPTGTMTDIGTINGNITVYHDTYHATNADSALVGYKGSGISDAGLIYSPYIMGLMNRAIDPEDFSPRVGVMARYAMTDNLLGAGRYYRRLEVTNLDTLI
tara:strand:- start:952 stop:2205 length:1254 start_codon:yes stop_codon:yes gene_type:complete